MNENPLFLLQKKILSIKEKCMNCLKLFESNFPKQWSESSGFSEIFWICSWFPEFYNCSKKTLKINFPFGSLKKMKKSFPKKFQQKTLKKKLSLKNHALKRDVFMSLHLSSSSNEEKISHQIRQNLRSTKEKKGNCLFQNFFRGFPDFQS